MARGLNKVMLIGHVGKDPEIRYTQGGSAVGNFSVATEEEYKDKSGEQQKKTEWHRIVVWGRTAEVMGEYLKKGQQVFIEGKLQTRSWDKDGQKHYTTEIVAFNVQFLGKRGDGATRDNGAPEYSDADAPQGQESTQPPAASGGNSDDDLPF